MIRAERHPRNRSERMILNNYRAMREVGEMKDLEARIRALRKTR